MAADLHIHAVDFQLKSLKHIPYMELESTPNIWIGEVSWLKAALFEDMNYVPKTVGEVSALVSNSETVELTRLLKEEILEAFDSEEHEFYSRNKKEIVEKWLEENIGKFIFTISW